MCFCPFGFSAQSVAEINPLTSRPKAAHFCSMALVSDKWSAESSVIKYSCICFSDRQAESTHTFSFQKILSNLIKNIFCPAKPLFLILRFTLNFKIICAQSESLICHSYAHCGSNFAQLICCSSSISQTGQQWVSDLIYTLDPWPLTEPDRFQSTKTHVSMPCPPPSHISTAQYSFLKLMPWLQVLSNTKSVILGSHGKSHGSSFPRINHKVYHCPVN